MYVGCDQVNSISLIMSTRVTTTIQVHTKRGCGTPGYCLYCKLEGLVNHLRRNCRTLKPTTLVGALHLVAPTLRRGRKEDAHEFFVNMMKTLKKCCLYERHISQKRRSYLLKLFQAEKQTQSHKILETTMPHMVFGGHLISQVQLRRSTCRCPSKLSLTLHHTDKIECGQARVIRGGVVPSSVIGAGHREQEKAFFA